MSKFKAGDIVVVTKDALEVGYPENRLGVNTIKNVTDRGVKFEEHPYVCSVVDLRKLTKLDKALK